MASKKGPKSTKNQTVETPAKDAPETQETQDTTQSTEPTPETEVSATESTSDDTTQSEVSSEETTQSPEGGETDEPTKDVGDQTPPPQETGDSENPASESKNVLATKLDEYIASMVPNRIVESDEIVRNQMRLRSIVNLLLATPAESFNDAMKTVVKKVRAERKGVFSERLIFRGFPQIKIARSERQKLETLISLLLATADAKQPGKVKDVIDMNVVYRYVKNDEQQQKLQSYYGA